MSKLLRWEMMLAAAKGTDWSDGRQTSSTKDRTLGMRKEMGSDIMTPAPGNRPTQHHPPEQETQQEEKVQGNRRMMAPLCAG